MKMEVSARKELPVTKKFCSAKMVNQVDGNQELFILIFISGWRYYRGLKQKLLPYALAIVHWTTH